MEAEVSGSPLPFLHWKELRGIRYKNCQEFWESCHIPEGHNLSRSKQGMRLGAQDKVPRTSAPTSLPAGALATHHGQATLEARTQVPCPLDPAVKWEQFQERAASPTAVKHDPTSRLYKVPPRLGTLLVLPPIVKCPPTRRPHACRRATPTSKEGLPPPEALPSAPRLQATSDVSYL